MKNNLQVSAFKSLTSLVTVVLFLSSCSSSDKKPDESQQANDSQVISEPKVSLKAKSATKNESQIGSGAAAIKNQLAHFYKKNELENLYKEAAKTIADDPQNVEALNAMGLYHLRKNRPLAARIMFDRALKVQPKNDFLKLNLALTFIEDGSYKDGISLLKKANLNLLNNLDIAAVLGSYYVQVGDYSKSFDVFSKVNCEESVDLKLLNNCAVSFAKFGQNEKAQVLFDKALRISSADQDLLLNYAIFQIDNLNKIPEANETLGRIKRLRPSESLKKQIYDLEKRAKTVLK